MTEPEFAEAWHLLDFTEDEWLEISCVDLEYCVNLVEGQPFRGDAWLAIADSLHAEILKIRGGHYRVNWVYTATYSAIMDRDLAEWETTLVRIVKRIRGHLKRCTQ